MQDVGYRLLGDQPGSQGDSVVSLTTRLGRPQTKQPPTVCGREKGAFSEWAFQESVEGCGCGWEPVRVVPDLSTTLGFGPDWPETGSMAGLGVVGQRTAHVTALPLLQKRSPVGGL